MFLFEYSLWQLVSRNDRNEPERESKIGPTTTIPTTFTKKGLNNLCRVFDCKQAGKIQKGNKFNKFNITIALDKNEIIVSFREVAFYSLN
jgi:hypothetical protein